MIDQRFFKFFRRDCSLTEESGCLSAQRLLPSALDLAATFK